jgi:hypothetical protein
MSDLDSKYAGYHTLEFKVYKAGGSWYWFSRNPLPNATDRDPSYSTPQDAFMAAVTNCSWPAGSSKPWSMTSSHTVATSDQRDIRIWRDPLFEVAGWRWAYFRGDAQDGRSYGLFPSREAALEHISKTKISDAKVYYSTESEKWYWQNNGSNVLKHGPFNTRKEAAVDLANNSPWPSS